MSAVYVGQLGTEPTAGGPRYSPRRRLLPHKSYACYLEFVLLIIVIKASNDRALLLALGSQTTIYTMSHDFRIRI
jgi:hypothetical protein